MLHRNFKFIEEDTFEVGYNPQKEWAWLITTAFFLGEVGAGLFLVSLFLRRKSQSLECTGRMADRGGREKHCPLYLPREAVAVLAHDFPAADFLDQPRLLCHSLMCRSGSSTFFYNGYKFTQAQALTLLSNVVMVLAGFCAFVVMIYDGIVMTYSPALAALEQLAAADSAPLIRAHGRRHADAVLRAVSRVMSPLAEAPLIDLWNTWNAGSSSPT